MFMPTWVSAMFSSSVPIDDIVVDEKRCRLYSKTEKGDITVWDISSNGCSPIAGITASGIENSATNIVK